MSSHLPLPEDENGRVVDTPIVYLTVPLSRSVRVFAKIDKTAKSVAIRHAADDEKIEESTPKKGTYGDGVSVFGLKPETGYWLQLKVFVKADESDWSMPVWFKTQKEKYRYGDAKGTSS